MKKKIIATTPFVAGMILAGSAVTAYASEQETTPIVIKNENTTIENNTNEIPTQTTAPIVIQNETTIENNNTIETNLIKQNTITEEVKAYQNTTSETETSPVVPTNDTTNIAQPSIANTIDANQSTSNDLPISTDTVIQNSPVLVNETTTAIEVTDQSNGIASNIITDILKSGLESLASNIGGKLGEWTTDAFMNCIFGTQTDQTQKILDSIEEVNNNQEKAINYLNQIIKILEKQEVLNDIKKYMDLSSSSLFTRTQLYMQVLKDAKGEYAERNRKNHLLWDLTNLEVGRYINLNRDSDYDIQVLDFGKALMKDNLCLDGNTRSTLDLMNKFDLLVNKWEHQGYVMRENYWNSLVNLYLSSASLMNASLTLRIQEYERRYGEGSADILRRMQDDLKEQINNLKGIADKYKVIRKADNIRYYQVPGHEATLYTAAYSNANSIKEMIKSLGSMPKLEFYDMQHLKENEIPSEFSPIYTVTDGIYKGKKAINSTIYQNIYNDYNPAGTSEDNKISLYDIFFKKENGNFTLPSDLKNQNDVLFISSDVWHKINKSGKTIVYFDWYICCSLFEGANASHPTWKKEGTQLINNTYTVISKLEEHWYDHLYYIPDEYINRMVMILPVAESNTPSNEEHELIDEWKNDDTYHWKECVEGDIVTISKHTYNQPTIKWSDDYKNVTATFVCDKDSCSQNVEGTISETKTEPTCTKEGKIVYTATFIFDGKDYTDTKEEVLKATGHTYAEPTFSWSDDYKSAQASFVCKDDQHEEVVEGTITEHKTDPTCTEKGKIVYTATFTFDGKDYTDTKVKVLEATGHTYAEPTISWSEDYKFVTATFTCEKDKHEEVVEGTISETKTEPTCTKDGKIVYTATFNFDDKEYNDTKEEVLKATGHTWKNGECSVCHEKETSTYSTNTKSTSKSSTTGTQTGVETKLGFLSTLGISSALGLSFLGLKRKKNK